MTFSEWFHALPIGLPDGRQYVYRDDEGYWRILRGKELAARSIDERSEQKAKRIAAVKRRRSRKRRRMTEGEFAPEAATDFLRKRLGIHVPPVSDA